MAVIEKKEKAEILQIPKKKKAHVGVSLSHPCFKCSLEKVCQTTSGAFETCL